MAAEPQTIGELVSFIDDGYKSEGEVDTRKLVADMNRKKKKSGGFQSMGKIIELVVAVLLINP